MSQIDELIQKIPRPVLVLGVLGLGLLFIVSQNPLQDGCTVEVENFNRNVKGVLVGFKNKKGKTQLPTIDAYKDLCKEGNSPGACENYYENLRKVTDSLRLTDEKCTLKLREENPQIIKVLSQGIQIMALNAWGERPPAGINERLGWLAQNDVYTFCRLRAQLVRFSDEEAYKLLRQKTYKEFPDAWPESISLQKRIDLPRPRAFLSLSNPKGTLSEDEVFKRSLFSLRCDLYL